MNNLTSADPNTETSTGTMLPEYANVRFTLTGIGMIWFVIYCRVGVTDKLYLLVAQFIKQ